MPQIKREVPNVDPKTEALDEYVNSGRHYQLNCIITGTADSGSLSLADVGQVIVERNGTQIMNVSAQTLTQMVDEWRGVIEVTNPSAGDHRIVVPIPFWYPEADPNALDVTSDQELRVEIQFNNSEFSSVFGTNAVSAELRSIRAPNTSESYTPRLRKSRLSYNGSGETDNEEINTPGVTRLFFRESGSDVVADDGLQVEQDDVTVVDNASPEILNDVANQLNRVESSPDSLFEYNPLTGPGRLGKSESYAKVTATSGASGQLEIIRLIT